MQTEISVDFINCRNTLNFVMSPLNVQINVFFTLENVKV